MSLLPPYCIYIALLEDIDIIKIGCTVDPGTRSGGIRSAARQYFGVPSQLTWLALFYASHKDEKTYLKQFDRYRLWKWEWFRNAPEIREFAATKPLLDVSLFYHGATHESIQRHLDHLSLRQHVQHSTDSAKP